MVLDRPATTPGALVDGGLSQHIGGLLEEPLEDVERVGVLEDGRGQCRFGMGDAQRAIRQAASAVAVEISRPQGSGLWMCLAR